MSFCTVARDGIPVGDVGFNETQHANGGFVEAHKGGIVQLAQSKELHDLFGFGRDANGTANANDESEFGFGGDVEATFRLGFATSVHGGLFGSGVLGVVLGGLVHVQFGVCGLFGEGGSFGLGLLFCEFGLSGCLFEEGLGFLHLERHGGSMMVVVVVVVENVMKSERERCEAGTECT